MPLQFFDTDEDGNQQQAFNVEEEQCEEVPTKSPFVKDGGGAACGLSKEQHYEWAMAKQLPSVEKGAYSVEADTHFWKALRFEVLEAK